MPSRDAVCTHCGCTDSRACPGGCTWYRVDYEARVGLCTSCVDQLLEALASKPVSDVDRKHAIDDARGAIAELRELDQHFTLERLEEPRIEGAPATVLQQLIERVERGLDSSAAAAGR